MSMCIAGANVIQSKIFDTSSSSSNEDSPDSGNESPNLAPLGVASQNGLAFGEARDTEFTVEINKKKNTINVSCSATYYLNSKWTVTNAYDRLQESDNRSIENMVTIFEAFEALEVDTDTFVKDVISKLIRRKLRKLPINEVLSVDLLFIDAIYQEAKRKLEDKLIRLESIKMREFTYNGNMSAQAHIKTQMKNYSLKYIPEERVNQCVKLETKKVQINKNQLTSSSFGFNNRIKIIRSGKKEEKKVEAKKKKTRSSRKSQRPKKKKEKQQHLEDEGQATGTENVYVYEPRDIDDFVELGRKNNNSAEYPDEGVLAEDILQYGPANVHSEYDDDSLKQNPRLQTSEISINTEEKTHSDFGCQTNNELNENKEKGVYSIDGKPCVYIKNTKDKIKNKNVVNENKNEFSQSCDIIQTGSLKEKVETRERSKSYGPSESGNDFDLNSLINSIMESNNEVIESMKANSYSDVELQTAIQISTEHEGDDAFVDVQLPQDESDGNSTDSGNDERLESVYHDVSESAESSENEAKDKTVKPNHPKQILFPPKLVITQASVESEESDGEQLKFNGNSEDYSEEERDSGTELRYDDSVSTENKTGLNTDYDYNEWVDKIKPLLYDAELVANLFNRLANKHAQHNPKIGQEAPLQHIHSAQIAYEVIEESNLTNFSSVVTYILSYLGAIKAEKPIPENVSIPSLLTFLEELIKRNTMSQHHVTMFTCFLSRPNVKLSQYHDLRVRFLLSCFKQEMSKLNVHTEEALYLNTCFVKLSEYFVQLDTDLAHRVTKEYLLPYINDHNSTEFIMEALTYMGLVKSVNPVITTTDITSALILLDMIFLSKQMSLLTSQKLYAFIQLNNPKFKFCAAERDKVTNTLKKQIDF